MVYAAIMAVIFLGFLRDSSSTRGLLVGLAVSLPLYVGLSHVMAKFGYQRKTLAELRTPRAAPRNEAAVQPGTGTARARPAPTRRTSGGPKRPTKKRR